MTTYNTDEKFFENDELVCFKSDYLSQWFIAPFELNGITYNCCEKYMMYKKALLFKDDETASLILNENIPKEQKKLGRLVKNFNEDVWNEYADNIVYEGNFAKFLQNNNLKNKLLLTNNKIIVECSPYDKIWGNGLDITTTLKTPINEWIGKNKLGKILMKVRETLKNNN